VGFEADRRPADAEVRRRSRALIIRTLPSIISSLVLCSSRFTGVGGIQMVLRLRDTKALCCIEYTCECLL
jgi:hypothetical protein